MTPSERKFRAMFSPKYCEICGARSTCLAKAAFWSCDEHKTAAKPPRDQLGSFEGLTLDGLATLTDAQLREQIDYWRSMKERSSGRDAMGYGNLLSVANHELKRRGHLTPPGTDHPEAPAGSPTAGDLPQSTPQDLPAHHVG